MRRQSWAVRLVKSSFNLTLSTTEVEEPYQGYQYSLHCTYLAMSLHSKGNLGFECSWEVNGWTPWSSGVKPLSFARVADLKRPLMGTVQERQGVIPLPADRPSQAIVDVSENMRAKLYSMFCKLGEFLQLVWRYIYTVVWRTVFGVLQHFTSILFAGFNAVPGLSTLDYVTVAVIEKYLDFKVRKVLPQTARSQCECCVTIQRRLKDKVTARYCKRLDPPKPST